MKNFTYAITLLFLFLLPAGKAFAQMGNTMDNPTDFGIKNSSFEYFWGDDTNNFTNDYYGRSTNDVFYKFTITVPMDIFMHTNLSELEDTYISLLDASGKPIAYNDDSDGSIPESYLGGPTKRASLLAGNLQAGTYYVVVEGYSQNGRIVTVMYGTPSWPVTFDLGEKGGLFTYTHTDNPVNNGNYSSFTGRNNFTAYKFTINRPMDITVSITATGSSYPEVELLDELGVLWYNVLEYGAFESGATSASFNMDSLPAGTYYVVSTGRENITTTIRATKTYGPNVTGKLYNFKLGCINTDNDNLIWNEIFDDYEIRTLFTVSEPVELIIYQGFNYFDQCPAPEASFTLTNLDSGEIIREIPEGTSNYSDLWSWSADFSYKLDAGRYQMKVTQSGVSEVSGGNYIAYYLATPLLTEVAAGNTIPPSTPSFPSSDQNYIRTRTYTNEAGTTYLDQIQYFDGLGRPSQTVQHGITPTSKDLVSIQEYDAFGREDKTWLPAAIANNNGAYVNPATVKTAAISSNGNDQKPYSLPVYEASPLNRVLKQYGPGQDWHKTYGSDSKAAETAY
ncbi:MAG: DUF6443 domain-containing protein, partial [Prevotella sp.]|nr:DUF6443 domain-containing protein [Prevotella sp.]